MKLDSGDEIKGPPNTFGCFTNHKAGRFICDTCGKRFKKPCLLRRHGVVHLAEKPFECSECRKQFTQSSSLKRHYEAQHNSNSERYQCVKCPLSFSQRGNLHLHDKKVHPPESFGKTKSFEYACDRCASVYSNKQKLSRHINTVHSNKSLGVTNLDSQDDLALTQSVLEQLKTFHTEMQALEVPSNVETPIDNDLTNIVNKADTQQIIDEPVINEVQLKDRLNVQGTECYLRVQRIVSAGGRYSYVCEFCTKEFRKSYDFLRHRRKHTQERPYKCAFCQSAFSTKTKQQKHVKIHRLDEHTGIFTKQYSCAVCDQAFSALRLLDVHMSTHAQTYMIKYRCKACEETFNTCTGLWSHKHTIVDEDLKFVQQLLPTPIEVYGNASASDSANVATKFEQHTKIRQNAINCKCVTCGRIFSNSSVLGNHRRVYHGTYRANRRVSVSTVIPCFKCVYCARFFKKHSHCKTHMLTHLKRLLYTGITNNKPVEPSSVNALVIVVDIETKETIKVVQFNGMSPKNKSIQENVPKRRSPMKTVHKCHICSSQFRKLCDLKRHLVTHTGERVHECPTCRKCFSLSSTLKQHELTHAAERQKHVCIVCGKSYAAKKSLNVHLRLHTGVQPFACEHCELKFRTSGQRIVHLKVVHGLQKYVSTE